MEKLTHWTNESVEAFTFRIAADFVAQLEMRMEAEGTKQQEFAERLGVSEGRVSQVLNNPGNMKLGSMVDYARALGLKISIVAYDDGDPGNHNGPINSQVFTECWERLGAPQDLFGLSHVPSQRGYKILDLQKFYRPMQLANPTILFAQPHPIRPVKWEGLRNAKQVQHPFIVRKPNAA